MGNKYYSYSAVQNLLAYAESLGYEYVPFAPEVLGYGGFVLIAPPCEKTGRYYMNIVVEEVYLNEWSCGHKIRRCRNISKALQKRINNYTEVNRE